MRGWAAHAIFATILLGSLAVQGRATDSLSDDASILEPAILRVAGSHGLELHEYRKGGGMMPRALIFEAPGCSQPVQVSSRLWTFEEETLMEKAPEQSYTRRYIYFDQSWDTPHPRAVFVQRMKYRVLAMFGLTEYEPSPYLILVETPKNCVTAEAIDWRSVWSRNYLFAAQSPGKVTPW